MIDMIIKEQFKMNNFDLLFIYKFLYFVLYLNYFAY